MNKLCFILGLFSLISCDYRVEKRYYETGELKEEFVIINGKAHGRAEGYYRNGSLKWESNFDNGKRDGKTVEYYSNGKIKTVLEYKSDKREGEGVSYDSLGNVVDKQNFLNGLPEGIFYKYYPNGQVWEKAYFKQGKRNGKDILYYPEGQISREDIYKEGKRVFRQGFDKSGNLYVGEFPLKITPKQNFERYQVNKSYEIEILLQYPTSTYSKLGIIIGGLDSNKMLKDTIDKFLSNGLILNYAFTPKIKGKQFITGMAFEIEINPDDSVKHIKAMTPFEFAYEAM